ncbi:class I SAM-dependent methyltransferase [Brachyspira intermedia]|uniref:O-methyltransferase n=1 Tax=Brachyspira intermedia TaxID=84377 RepID=UPI003007B3EF
MLNNPENYDNEILKNIDNKISEYSEMSINQREFFNGIIRQLKPKKILEVGVSAGASAALILNAIKDMPESHLYSIDYLDKWYRDPEKDVGFVVKDYFKDLQDKWTLYTGGVSAKFIDEIGGDIDLCLLDTMHCSPGEFLDFLMVFPYLKKNAVVVIHDLILHTSTFGDFNYYRHTTNCTLFTVLKGKKILLEKDTHSYRKEKYYSKMLDISGIPNIGAIILDDYNMENIRDIFMLLSLPWVYKITDDDYLLTLDLFIKHYPKDLVNMFERIYLFNRNFNINPPVINHDHDIPVNRINLLDLLFSIEDGIRYKVIRILGIKITIKKK